MKNKSDFLNSASVKIFLQWIMLRMDNPNSFLHCYNMKKPVRSWTCDSLYSAYENYCWPFRFKDPMNDKLITGNTFYDSAKALKSLSQGLRESIDIFDNETCMQYCLSILQWGGVLPKNDKRIIELGNDICQYLIAAQDRLNSDIPSNQFYTNNLIMNSGFTKIYSLYIDNFTIYDGRVGAALGLLVRVFCEENKLERVPDELIFAWGKGKESTYKPSSMNKRNPSKNTYIFPELSNNPKRHIENNIRANWLLKEIIDETNSKFNQLDKDIQMRALEASLFMIGYDITG